MITNIPQYSGRLTDGVELEEAVNPRNGLVKLIIASPLYKVSE